MMLTCEDHDISYWPDDGCRLCEAKTEISRLSAERDQAIAALSKAAEARGRAEGKLAASELPGIIDGWKARAEKAEAEVERLRGIADVDRKFAKKTAEDVVVWKVRAEMAETECNEGKKEAVYLANILWERHYKNKSPNFELLNTISGVVSQIDNMVAGIIDERDTALAQMAAAFEAAANAVNHLAGDDHTIRWAMAEIRVLTPADAQQVLNKLLTEAEQRGYANAMRAERKDADQRISKAREDAIREAADVLAREYNICDIPINGVVIHGSELTSPASCRDAILALLNDGGRDE